MYTVSVGFNLKSDATGTISKLNSLAWNGFFTAAPSSISALPAGYITAGLSNLDNSSDGRRLGYPIDLNNGNEFNPYVSGLSVSSAAVGNGVNISMSGAGSLQDFRHKGLMQLSGAASDFTGSGKYSSWVKAENPFVRAKVMAVSADGYTIKVNDTSIFDLPTAIGPSSDDELTYLVYQDGLKYSDRINRKLTGIVEVKGNYITLTNNVNDMFHNISGSGYVGDNWKKNNLERMWISPRKYWLYIMMMNANNVSGAVWGDWAGTRTTESTLSSRPQMTFNSLNVVTRFSYQAFSLFFFALVS